MAKNIVSLLIVLTASLGSVAQDSLFSVNSLKKLSIEELMNLEVTLVNRTPERLSEAASAIQVITGEDVRRSGASNIPEALRLVANLQVAQLNAGAWIISSRGFNTIFANKLLVMIDGRSVYTPFFGGVLWEMQNVLLEDLDRIEIISGPGATMWGANAVNGVINIVTKKASATKGAFVSAQAGNFIRNQFGARYGGQAGKFSYRVYGQHFNRNATKLPTGEKNTDSWRMSQGGFRVDFSPRSNTDVTVQGDYQGGTRKTAGGNSDLNQQNILARWQRRYADKSQLMIQSYYDHYSREDRPSKISDQMKTFDLDVQYGFRPFGKHKLMTGVGVRLVKDRTISENPNVAILPAEKRLDRFNAFIQDEISLTDKFKLVAGTKIGHNVYTGMELQPGVRVIYNNLKNSVFWASASRALRTPSRFDVDYYLPSYPVPPPDPSVAGGPNFVSEKLMAYEAGLRFKTTYNATFSFATFYNVYTDVYSVEALPGTLTYQIQNGSEGKSWGGEFSAAVSVSEKWRLRGGYTYFDKKLEPKPGRVFNPDYLGNDARNQVVLQSIVDLPWKLEWDIVGRYLDYLPQTIATARVPSYITFDMRLAFVSKFAEFSLVAQNLLEDTHTEFGVLEIPRGFFAKLNLRF